MKDLLTTAPVLAYPQFQDGASAFILHTDASDRGLGAVLEQDGRVVAYTSRALTQSERNYSVIQRECLAVVYAVKQFRHYLLGRPFQLFTDHAPLQWLSGQKMEGMLCRWALALQEFDFTISYTPGAQNVSADALSHCTIPHHSCSATFVPLQASREKIRSAQQQDSTITELHQLLSESRNRAGQEYLNAARNAPISPVLVTIESC